MPGICEDYVASLLDCTAVRAMEDIPRRVVTHSWQIAKAFSALVAQKLCVLCGVRQTNRRYFCSIGSFRKLDSSWKQ